MACTRSKLLYRRILVVVVLLCAKESKQITLDVRSSRVMRYLSRQIEACGSDVAQCLSLLKIHENEIKADIDSLAMERVYLQALQVVNMAMKKNRGGDKGYLLNIGRDLQRNCPTDSVRARMITICGNCGAFHEALNLLRKSDSIQCYNAALSACSKNGEWEQALLLLQQMDNRSVLSCNIVLGALAQRRQGTLATDLLRDMTDRSDFPIPDQHSLQHTIRAIMASSGHTVNSSALLLLKEFWAKTSSRPNNATIDLLSKAHYRTGDWKVVKTLESIRHHDAPLHLLFADGESTPTTDDEPPFAHWEHPALHKVKSGASSHWEFGSLFMESQGVRFTLALKPNRDPSKNGIRLVLLDSVSGEKVGYLLMINGCEGDSAWSRLLGLFIRPDMRKLGLSKVLLAVWLHMCVGANLRPGAGVIRKPLLSMVLEHTFEFLPDSQPTNPSTIVEIIPRQPCDGAKLQLYAPGSKSLQGVFTPREIEREQIEVLLDTPPVRGKRCHIGATFSLDLCAEEIQKLVTKQLNGDNQTIHICTNQDLPWRLTMLGKLG